MGRNTWRRVTLALALGAVVLAALGGTARAADLPVGELLDVSKQVAKIQAQVDALVAGGQLARTGDLSTQRVCGIQTPTRVFARWGDAAYYVPAPSGSLAATIGWSWDKNSRPVVDNSPLSGGQALFLGDKGSAASAVACVTTLDPTIRFLAKNTGAVDSTLTVSVLYEALDGKVKELKLANLSGRSKTWAPTTIVPYRVNLIAAASPGGVTAVAFKFKVNKGTTTSAAGTGWTIDDLYIDPYKIH